MRRLALSVCAFALLPIVALAQTAPPSLLQLQGRLTDNAGQPITSATRDLRVEFYDSAVGGLLLGSSTVVDPTMTNGIYSVSIAPPAGVFANNASVFMEMAVGSGAAGADGAFEVLSPRTRVLASAYALNADTLDGRDSSFFAQASSSFVQNGNAFGALATLGTNDAFGLAFETGGTERARIDTAGNVSIGLGAAIPDSRLHVMGDGRFAAPDGRVAVVGPSNFDMNNDYTMGPGAGGTGWTLRTGDAPTAVRLTGAGNVGIGTTSPGVVNGTTFTGVGLHVSRAAGGAIMMLDGGSRAGVYMYDRDATPDQRLYQLRSENDGVELVSWNDTESSERVLVAGKQSGNVGVGTTSPSLRLHVAGDARVGTLRDQAPSDPPGWGDACVFSGGPVVWGGSGWGSDNSDPLWMARFNQAANETELRVVIGDDPGQLQDKLVIGTMQGSGNFSKTVTWGPIMTVSANGNVGIGTTTPGARLTVVAGGTTDTFGANGSSEGFDIAEAISAAADVEVGDLVSADPSTSQRVVRARTPYDPTLLGVITSQPAIAIGATDGNRHIALAGRVAVRVSLENGPIHRGDCLTSSSLPGLAMRATEPGRVVGVALGECAREGDGKVVVYVSPGWWDGGRTAEQAEELADVRAENAALRDRVQRLEEAVGRLERLGEGKEAASADR